MPNYLLFAGGQCGGGYPWSFRSYATSTSTEATVATAWETALAAMFNLSAFNALVPTTTILSETYASTMSADWKQTTKTPVNVDIAGTATVAMPPHVAACVTWRTQYATRYGRGRWYLPPLGTGALAASGSFMSAAAQTDVVNAVNAFLSSIVPTVTIGLLCRNGTKGGTLPALTFSPITHGDVGNDFTTQRRRADKYQPTRVSLTF